MKTLIIASGGLDSTVLTYLRKAEGDDLHLLSFDYGQRHKKELDFARRSSYTIGATWILVDMKFMNTLLPGSALTDPNVDVPEGHYAEETMKATIVPNRNAMMLSVAYAVAIAHGMDNVCTGVHAGDHAIYPDCRPEFISSFQAMEVAANGGNAPTLIAPFLYKTKAEIVSLGASLEVPFNSTWSCYVGGSMHCGRCGTCVERKEAFRDAGVPDPTDYQDPTYLVPAYR